MGQRGTALSVRERQAVEAVRAHFAAHGRPPSYKELGERLGVGCSQAHELVKRAARSGHLAVQRRRGFRTEIRLLSPAAELSTAELVAEYRQRAENDPKDFAAALAA